MTKLTDYIVTGKLQEKELLFLKKSSDDFKEKSILASVTNAKKGKVNKTVIAGTTLHLKPDRKTRKIYNIIHSHMIDSYSDIFSGFDYSKLPEIQYAYYGTGDFFKTHKDSVKNKKNDKIRCLTMSINLSEEDEYGEGELLVYPDKDTTVSLDRTAGSFIIFPSFFLHEAKTVEHGNRHAIVSWLTDSRSTFDKFDNFVNYST